MVDEGFDVKTGETPDLRGERSDVEHGEPGLACAAQHTTGRDAGRFGNLPPALVQGSLCEVFAE